MQNTYYIKHLSEKTHNSTAHTLHNTQQANIHKTQTQYHTQHAQHDTEYSHSIPLNITQNTVHYAQNAHNRTQQPPFRICTTQNTAQTHETETKHTRNSEKLEHN